MDVAAVVINKIKQAKAISFNQPSLDFDMCKDAYDIAVGGIFGSSSDFNSSHDMYLIADEELYKAKNAGRNKVFLRNKNII